MRWTDGPPDLPMMIGRIFERTETMAERQVEIQQHLTRIDTRLAQGGERFSAIETKLGEVAATANKAASTPPPPAPPPVEVWIKAALPFVVWGLTLWLTGSIDAAFKMMASVRGGG